MKNPEVYGSVEPIQLKIPIMKPNFMVYSEDGKLMNGLVPVEGIKGFINVSTGLPFGCVGGIVSRATSLLSAMSAIFGSEGL